MSEKTTTYRGAEARNRAHKRFEERRRNGEFSPSPATGWEGELPDKQMAELRRRLRKPPPLLEDRFLN